MTGELMHVGLTQLLGATGVSFTAVMEMSEGEYTEQFVCMCLCFFFSFSLSKFDMDMASTTGNRMQCMQSCSWQMLIGFGQTNISCVPICLLTLT